MSTPAPRPRASRDLDVYELSQVAAGNAEQTLLEVINMRQHSLSASSFIRRQTPVGAATRDLADSLSEIVDNITAALAEGVTVKPMTFVTTTGVGTVRKYETWSDWNYIDQETPAVRTLPRIERTIWTMLFVLGVCLGALLGVAASASLPDISLPVAVFALVGLSGTVASVWAWARDVERQG